MEQSSGARPGRDAPPSKGRQNVPGNPYPIPTSRNETFDPAVRGTSPAAKSGLHRPGPIRRRRGVSVQATMGSSTQRMLLGEDTDDDEEKDETMKPTKRLQSGRLRDDLVELGTYDAGPDESVTGSASIDDYRLWTKPAAQFIRSDAGITGSPDVWVGKQPLGEGGFGLAGLWEKIDAAGNVVDRMVIKQIGRRRDGRWNPYVPQEVRIMGDMNSTGCLGVVQLRNYRRYLKHSIHRIYMEYCPYGDLRRLYKRYRRFRQNIPEPFLWEVFYYLTDACAAMVNGPSGASWDYEIVHRDIKPGNIFLGLENPSGVPFYPVAKLGDFGLAVQTSISDPANPFDLVGEGTRQYMAPEQISRQHYPIFLQGSSKRLASYTNTWAVGATMYELLTLHRVRSALFEGETDPEGGIEGLPEIVTGKYPEYSEALRTLVRQCLRPNPQDRPRIADMETQIQACRRQIAEHFYELRGDNKSVPSDEERLYYRGNEIETMEPGYWLPSNPRNFGGPESGFADPDLGPIQFPRFPSLDMAVATGEGHQTNQHGDEGRKLNRAQYANTKAQGETVDVEGYGPDGTETDHDGDPMDEVTIEPRTTVKPGRGLMNKFGRPTMI